MLRTGLFALVVLATVFGSLKWYFWEPSNFHSESLAFRFKVDDAVKRFPLFAPESDPTYTLRIADGVKPSLTLVQYATTLNLQELQETVEAQGFTCEQSNEKLICDRQESSGYLIQLSGDRQTSPVTVAVAFLGVTEI